MRTGMVHQKIKALTGKTSAMGLMQFGITLFKMPHRFIKAILKIQMDIMYLPIRIIHSFYRISLKTLESCNRFVQAISDLEHESPCKESVQVNSESGFESPCNKSVQVNGESEFGLHRLVERRFNGESEFESRFNKSVQVNGESEFESPFNKSVQVNGESEFESHSNKSVQVNGESEFESPCNKSVQVNGECDYNQSVQVSLVQGFLNSVNSRVESPYKRCTTPTFGSEKEFPNDDPVPSVLTSKQELFLGKSGQNKDSHEKLLVSDPSKFENTSDETSPVSDSHYKEDPPVFKTGADYVRYSKICLARTLKEIEDLPKYMFGEDFVDCTQTADPAKSQKQKKIEDNSKATAPVKQIFRDIHSKERTIEGIQHFIDSSKSIAKNRSQTPTNEDSQNGQQVLNLSVDVLHNMVDIISQEIGLLKWRLKSINSKIEIILQSSRTICGEVSKVNERVNRLVTLSSKITDLQNHLCNGNTLLKEVEADRNEMHHKLSALARLIKEEEEYLDDVSIESGYDEIEMGAYSSCKHGV